MQDSPIFKPKTAPRNPAEFAGVICKVVDGDTVDVKSVGRVRFADIDCPEMDTPKGPEAKEFTTDCLLNRTAYLDVDDLRKTDSYGRLVAVLYLLQPNGSFQNVNKQLVEAGQACIWDHKENEFSPADWWGGQIPDSVCIKGGVQPRAVLSPAAYNDLLIGSAAPGKFRKYHLPSCSIAQRIGEAELVTFSSPEEARARGYIPCTVCHPP